MTNVGPAFAHPALAQVAASPQMLTLHQAATSIGAADPLIALRYIDCSPDGITALAQQVQAGTQSIGSAHTKFSHARSTADSAWTGPAATAFDQQAAGLDRYYGAVYAVSESTADAGGNIAQNLSDLASSVANKSASIAGQVYPASYVVAQGDRTPNNVQLVNDACRSITVLVQNADSEIPTIAAGLNGLTTPTPGADEGAGRSAS